MKKEKTYTFKEFKLFLATNCWDLKMYKEGKYDLKIYRWFDVGKPKKVNFFTADGNFKKFRKPKQRLKN